MAENSTPEWAEAFGRYIETMNTNLSSVTTGFTDNLRRINRRAEDKNTVKFPDAETFDGTNNHVFRTWVIHLTVFFDTQPNKFTTDQSKIFYAGNRLRGTALEWFGRQMGSNPAKVGTDEHPAWVSWSAFTEDMRDLFGRRDEESEARRKLDNIQQGNRDLVAYVNELEQLSSITTQSDELKLYIFKRGLHQGLRDRLALWPRSLESYSEALQAALQLSRQTEEFQQPMQRYQPRARPHVAAAAQVQTSTSAPLRSTPKDPDAMDWSVDATTVPRGPLTPEEKARRRIEGLCHYCGNKGHIAIHCPAKQQRAPPRNSALPGQNPGN